MAIKLKKLVIAEREQRLQLATAYDSNMKAMHTLPNVMANVDSRGVILSLDYKGAKWHPTMKHGMSKKFGKPVSEYVNNLTGEKVWVTDDGHHIIEEGR